MCLSRLAREGTTTRQRTGRSWAYTPAASRESYISSLMRDVLGQAGDPEAALVHFALTAACCLAAIHPLARARRAHRTPRTTLVLWQALGLTL